jgi:hypothetical protein
MRDVLNVTYEGPQKVRGVAPKGPHWGMASGAWEGAQNGALFSRDRFETASVRFANPNLKDLGLAVSLCSPTWPREARPTIYNRLFLALRACKSKLSTKLMLFCIKKIYEVRARIVIIDRA